MVKFPNKIPKFIEIPDIIINNIDYKLPTMIIGKDQKKICEYKAW